MSEHLTPLRAAYITQLERTYRRFSRGIPTPEQCHAWEADADAIIAAHDAEVRATATREERWRCIALLRKKFGITNRAAGWLDREVGRWPDQVRAEAWDEGHEAGTINAHEHRHGRRMTNPYREGGAS